MISGNSQRFVAVMSRFVLVSHIMLASNHKNKVDCEGLQN